MIYPLKKKWNIVMKDKGYNKVMRLGQITQLYPLLQRLGLCYSRGRANDLSFKEKVVFRNEG